MCDVNLQIVLTPLGRLLCNINMSRALQPKNRRQSIEAQFANAERAFQRLNKTIDAQLERAQDLEVQRAIALYKSGRAKVYDMDESIRQARQLAG